MKRQQMKPAIFERMDNPDRLHTAGMEVERIRRNAGLVAEDPVQWCLAKILEEKTVIERKGKNWHVRSGECVIPVNASGGTIITAHRERPRKR